MSDPATDSHPAFYHSKKRIWDFPITTPPSGSKQRTWGSRLNTYCVGGFDSLWKLWYAVFVVVSTCWLVWLAILRYQEFKMQSFHPRFGFEWNWHFPMNLQVACLVVVVSLFPVLVYSAISRVGHSANDGITLGRDCLHLHAMLAQLPCFRLAQRSADPEAAERLRSRIAHSTQSLNETPQSPDFESFIIQDRTVGFDNGGWWVAARRQLRPFACLIHVLIAFALLLPVSVFEAEQIKNEAIRPDYVWRSNLDWLLNSFRLATVPNKTQANYYSAPSAGNQLLHSYSNEPRFESIHVHDQREVPNRFAGHPYPSNPPDISPEFVVLATALVVLTVRIAAPFWFTSRVFSILLSLYTAVTGCYVLLEAATVELLLKIFTAGVRDQFGARVDLVPVNSQLFEPWVCTVVSGIGFLSLLAGLMAFYSLGELLFQQSVTNYANLIMAGEFDAPKQGDPFLREEKGSALLEDASAHEIDLYGPSVIAVTTKVWRPSRRNPLVFGNSSSRAATPSALSASSDTLRSKSAINSTAQPSVIGKSTNLRSSVAFWPSLTSAFSFCCLAITRSCLFGPMLQCFWHARVRLPLIFVILSILYLILWLVLWFGVAVKTAWRFRLLHMPAPSTGRSRLTSPKHRSHAERLGLGVSQFAPWPLMNNPAAAQLGASYFWPWLQCQNGFIPAQNGSLAFGGSSTPYEGNYANRGPSGANSVYGCFTEARQANPGGLLRDGPPTLSDESENAIQMGYDRSTNYAYLQKGAGLVTICDGDIVSDESYQPFRGNSSDPAYVSLASLGRAGSPQRSQGGSRRVAPGARVTFKSDDEVGGAEGNNASSDSGVCTNGSGSRITGKLNLTSHPLFVGASDRASSPQGFITAPAASTVHSPIRLESDERLCSQV
ncbi:unnamed protein product [Mesocestoides corti]|uniref:Lipase_3 domain-containing protein n=1 Tax=Mesocestoides corti TaxID=53468 RepID=A0A0R3UEB1_MESCO|nr:unnamed protein product [Mesocestoides corti]